MVCSLCLEDITEGQEKVIVDECLRHKTCSDEFEVMVDELAEIYINTCPQDDI